MPTSAMVLNCGKMGYDTDVSFRAEHSTLSYSLHVCQLWVPVLINVEEERRRRKRRRRRKEEEEEKELL